MEEPESELKTEHFQRRPCFPHALLTYIERLRHGIPTAPDGHKQSWTWHPLQDKGSGSFYQFKCDLIQVASGGH